MSSVPGPRRPLPASVYRRRRALVLLALVAVIVVIVVIAVRAGAASGDKSGAGQGTGAKTDNRSTVVGSGTPSASASGQAGGACAPSVVKVVPITDAASYAAGVQPQLSMSITNSGTTPCTFDVGTGAQDYTISSGAEQIWNSKDCQTGPTDDVRTLEPGSTLTTQPFAWDRTRSSKTTCDAARTAVVAGGASYHLGVTLGQAKSDETKQFILS